MIAFDQAVLVPDADIDYWRLDRPKRSISSDAQRYSEQLQSAHSHVGCPLDGKLREEMEELQKSAVLKEERVSTQDDDADEWAESESELGLDEEESPLNR